MTDTIQAVRDATMKEIGYDIFLHCEVGSGLHGIAIEGTDDHDELIVFIEPPERLFSITGGQETYVRRSKPEGVASEPGDIDLTAHCLRKYMRLLVAGNPTLLQTLFVPNESRYEADGAYYNLAKLAPRLRTKKTAGAFLGYLKEQRARLVGERGQKGVKRAELVARYGYDTKYAGHALRLGLQGNEFMQTGAMQLPMELSKIAMIRDVREGKLTLEAVLHMIDKQAGLLEKWMDSSLPSRTSPEPFEHLLTRTYQRAWSNLTGVAW